MKSISEEKRTALEKLGMHPELMLCPATGRVKRFWPVRNAGER